MGKLSTSGYRSRSRLADLGRAFDPALDVAWKHLYYAGGTAFQALGLSDGASMAAVNWPDEIAANAANLTGGSGTYQAANAAFNNKPSVLMPGSGSGKKHTGTVAAGAQIGTLPFTIIAIFELDSVASPPRYLTDGANDGGSGGRCLLRISAGPVWSMYGGIDRTGGTPTTGIKAARMLFTSGSDTLTVNGSTIVSGVDAGSPAWQGVTLSENTVEMSGRWAFYGAYVGDLTADTAWAALQAWVPTNYGVPLS